MGFSRTLNQYPLLRGMLSYGVIWPTCSITQEYLEYGTSLRDANWMRAARFGVFGAIFMAPVFYAWMQFSNRFFKAKSLKTAIRRAIIEQLSYSPLAMSYFFFGMSALELKPFNSCVKEVKEKFLPTYLRGIVYWPTMQTINFYFISHKNRIVFASCASFIWTVYLAHVKDNVKVPQATFLAPLQPASQSSPQILKAIENKDDDK